jgi:hypothetical protein
MMASVSHKRSQVFRMDLDMALDYDTDLKVVLIKDTEDKKLYKWNLIETDEKGNQIGNDYIPFHWRINFHSVSFGVRRNISSEGDFKSDDEETGTLRFSKNDVIFASLKPGYFGDEDLRTPSFALFGSSRKVENIGLHIHRVDDVKKEKCKVSAGVAYDYEGEFRNEREEDWIEIVFALASEKFDSIFELILKNEIEHLSVELCGVEGFYSNWSPTIYTDSIKALGNIENQGLRVEEDWKERIPVVGKAGEASLTVQRTLQAKLPVRVDPYAEEQRGKKDPSKAISVALEPTRDQLAAHHSLHEMWFRRISNLLIVLVVIELFRAFAG